ncbi:MAG: choice-of-anchor D domain-containing protein [Planctomycetes bacterium]|nr:choice-of-anchor D domain-containing protein [Planctomycetota bacterium]
MTKCGQLALVALIALASGLSAQVVSLSASPNIAIPDNSDAGADSTITIPNSAPYNGHQIGALQIGVRVDHPRDQHLDMYLVPPGVTWNRSGANYVTPPPAGVVDLSTDNGGNNPNYGSGAGPYVYTRLSVTTDPVFQSTQAVTAGSAPFTANSYTVEGVNDFNALYRTSPVGDWKLVVLDDQGGQTGTLISWEVRYVHGYFADPGVAIPDGSRTGVASTISIPASGDLIGSLQVGLRISHANDTHLDIYLVPPGVTWAGPYTLVANEFSTQSEALNVPIPRGVIELSTDNGGGANYGTTAAPSSYARFSAAGDPVTPGLASVTTGVSPFTTMVYSPEGSDWLELLYGRPAAGNWTLIVADDTGTGTGTLVSWEILYTPVAANTLYAHLGDNNDPGLPIARGQAGQVLGQYRMEAVGGAANNLTSIVFHEVANTTLTSLISAASLYRDNNGDGLLDGGDTLLAAGVLAGANATFNFAQAIGANAGVNLLLVGTVVAAPAPASMQIEILSAASIGSPLTEDGLFPVRAGPRPFVTATTFTYRPGQPDLITDNDEVGITRGITIPATSDRVGSMRVGIRLDHTYDQDLDIYLLPPGVVWNPPYAVPNNGPVITAPPQVIELSTDNGGGGNNWGSNATSYTYNYARLSGANDPTWPASSLITGGGSPFTAQPQYRVEGTTAWNLSYNGNPSGTWQLIVVDSWGQDVGYLVSWQLEYVPITTPQFWANIGDSNNPGLPATTGTAGNVFGQLELSAYFGANSVTQITAREVNNFNIGNNLSAIALYRDVNANGVYDPGTDTLVANGGMAGAVATFNIAGGFNVASGATEFLLIVGTVQASPANTVLSLRHATNADIVGSTSEIAPYPLDYGAHPLNPPNTYVSTPPFGKSIPDNNAAGITDTITIPATSDLIGALRIGIRIDHANDADLDIWLIPPGVTWAGPYTTINNGANVTPPAGVIELSTDNGGTGNDYGTGAVSFVYARLSRNGDRQFSPGNTPVTGGTAPFTAANGYIEEGTAAFNALYGTNPSGNWTIAIADDGNGGTGRLISWFVQYVPAERAQVKSVPTAGFSNFGNVAVGAPSAAQGFQVQNMGNFSLTLPAPVPANGIRITGANASDFVIQGVAPSGVLAAGASTATYNIVFTPGAVGLRTANITVTWNNSDATMPATATSNYAISGTGVVPTISVVGGPLSFGNVEIGTNSAAQSYSVSGTFLAANLVVTPPANFQVALAAGGPWLANLSLVPASGTVASTTVFVRFNPASLGAAAGNVSNASTGAATQNVAVSGTGAGITVSTAGPLAFGNQQVSTASAAQSYNVQGVGLAANLVITPPANFEVALAAGGPWLASLSRTPAQAATLTTIFVRFNPAASGAFSGNVTNASAPYTTRNVAVTGTGIAGILSTPLGPVNYGSTNVFTTSPLSPITHALTNTGSAVLTVTALNFIGANAADWAVTSAPGLPFNIGIGATVNIQASFTPQGTGGRAATLRITSNTGGPAGQFTDVSVTGNALVGTLSTAASANYGTGNLGSPTNLSPVTHTFTNTGTGTLTITALAFVGGDAADWSFVVAPSLPMLIGPGASNNVQARLIPTAVGARNSTLRVTSDSGGTSGNFNIAVSGSGTAGVLTTSLNVAYGTSNLFTPSSLSPVTHTINNTGTGTLTISNIQFTGGQAAMWAFSPAPSLPIVILAGGNANVTAVLTPTATGALASTLRFTSDSGGFINTLTDVNVTGTGTVATLSTPLGPVDYGTTNVFTVSPLSPITHTVTNTGSGTLTISGASFVGANGGDWSFTAPAPTFPINVTPGGNTAFQVRFIPQGTGSRNGTLRFFSNTTGPINTQTDVALTGNGTVGTLSATTPVAYGSSNVGVTSSPVGHTLNNTGTGPLTITGLVFTTGNASDWAFTVAPSFPTVIAAGGNVVISATFTPGATGARSSLLRITSDSGGTSGDFDVTVNGTGTQAVIGVTTPVNYGNSNLGVPTSPATNHQVNNSGTGPMRITGIALGGANAGDWALSGLPAFPATVAGSGNIVFSGVFTPSATGPRTATISITWDQGAGVGTTITNITLNGTGTVATLATATPVAYGSSNVGVTSSPVGHTLNNTGTGPLTITALAFTTGNASDWAFTVAPSFPIVIAAGGNVLISATFTPGATGARSSLLRITSDSGGTSGDFDVTVNGTGTQAVIGVTTPVNYGNSNLGVSTSPATNHQVNNTGTGPMRITGIALGGANASDWALSGLPAFPATVAAAGNMVFSGVFTPSATGPRTATISITWDQGAGVGTTITTITLNGTGTQAVIGVTTPVNYGNSNLGVSTSPATNHQVNNTGTGPMRITGIALGGANASDWALSGLPAFPATVAAAGNMVFSGVFTPSATGPRTATISITWDQGGGVGTTITTITLNGTGTQAVIGVTTPVNYGNSNLGVSTSPATNHQVNNTGTGPMRITGIALGGANASDWALSGLPAFPATVAGSGNIVFSGVFTPSATGPRTATVSITWDQGAGVGTTITTITLNGTGTVGTLTTATPVAYGSINLFQTTSAVNHTLNNTGTGPLTITGLVFTTGNASDWAFTVAPSLPIVIAAGGNVVISATLTPSAVGARNSLLRITSDSGGTSGDFDVTVNGTGTVATLATATPVAYGSSNVGVTSSPVGHTLNNTGTGPLTITGLVFTTGNASDWAFTVAPSFPIVVAAGGNVVISATFTPGATGARSSLLRITSDSGGTSGDFDVAVSGTGTTGSMASASPVIYPTINVFQTGTAVTHTLSNTGSGPLSVTNLQFITGNASDWAFTVAPTYPINIGAGLNVNVQATFTPGAPGARSTLLRITYNSGGPSSDFDVVCNGTGTVGTLTTTTPVAYGSINLFQTTGAVNHTLNNTGTGPLTITGLAFTTGNASDWAFTVAPSFPIVIAAGSNVVVSATFTPGAVGARNSLLRTTSDSGGTSGDFDVAVTGTGTVGTLSTATPVGYGSLNLFQTSGAVNHTLNNTGTGPLTITGLAFTTGNASDWAFTVAPSFPIVIAAGGNVVVSATFTPGAIGGRNSLLRITSDSGGTSGNFDVTVTGTGTVGTLAAASPVDFGTGYVGSPSNLSPLTHTLNNTGTGPLTITGLAFTTGNATDWTFAVAPSLPVVVAAGGNFQFDAVFTPGATGARASLLRITSDSGGSSGDFDVTLTGNGVPPASVTAVTVSADNGGPLTVQATINGPVSTFIDVVVTYSGGANAGPPVLVSTSAGTISGNTILGVPSNTTITLVWDAYATERHTTAFNYVLTLSPFIGVQPGTPGSSPAFTLQRNGGWTQHVTPSEQATPVLGHVAVYDEANDRMVVFGGKIGTVRTNRVWVYERGPGSVLGWKMLSPSGTAPSSRQYSTALYDAANDRMVVFGGLADSGTSAQVWALDLTPGAEAWTLLAGASPATPAARYAASFTYDAGNQRALMHGGVGSGYQNDTWALDLTLGAESWGTGPVTTGGPSRSGQAAALDASGNRLVIYGGQSSTGTNADTWQMNLTTFSWSSVATAGAPGARYFGTYLYDSVSNRIVVQSGYNGGAVRVDGFAMPLSGPNQHVWSQLPGDPAAAAGRVQGAAAFDPVRQQGLFYGGFTGSVALVAFSVLDLSVQPPAFLGSPTLTSNTPPARWGATIVFDSFNNQLVLFGGKDANNYYSEIWVMDRSISGAPWVRLNVAGGPGARVYHAATFDAVNRRMIVCGGQDATGTRQADIWTLDLAGTPVWTAHAGSGPLGSIRHSLVYDSLTNRAIMHGGFTTTYVGTTWAYDFGLSAWTQLVPSGLAPAARYGHGAMFDAAQNRMVIFGGRHSSAFTNEVWSFELTTMGWTNISQVGGTQPVGRALFGCGNNTAGTMAWLFGGDTGVAQSDLWQLDVGGAIAAWTQLAFAAPAPSARTTHAGAYDGSRLVIGFGLLSGAPLRDVWQIDPSAPAAGWTQLGELASPSALAHTAVALDPVNRRLIAFGGLVDGLVDASLWSLDLASPIATWQRIDPPGARPGTRRTATMIYDAGSSRMILYGGRTGVADSTITDEVWALTLTPGSESWTLLATSGASPGKRAQHVAVVDGAGRMVIFGGRAETGAFLNTTYALNLSTLVWAQVAATGSINARIAAAAIYDPVGDRMILYGGSNNGTLTTLHSLNMSGAPAWTTMAKVGTAPAGLFYHSMVYDPALHRMLVYGGFNAFSEGRLFSMDLATNTWTEILPPVARPQNRWAHGAVWDAAGSRMVVVSGYLDGEVSAMQQGGLTDLWFWGD